MPKQTTLAQSQITTKLLRKKKRHQEKCKTTKAKPKLEKRYDKTWNRRQTRKTQKKTQRILLNL